VFYVLLDTTSHFRDETFEAISKSVSIYFNLVVIRPNSSIVLVLTRLIEIVAQYCSIWCKFYDL